MTRDEWCQMWESIKKIEAINQLPKPYILEKNKQYVEIQFIKKLIQKEIGQME